MPHVLYTIIPLLIFIVIGYIGGKIYKLSTSQYGYMVAFILAPLVTLGGILRLDFKIEYIFLPIFVFFICSLITLISFKSAKLYLKGSIPNLAGMASSGGNTGFFGLPVFLLFSSEKLLGVYLLANLGTQIAEVTVGYYIGARGNYTIKESIIKLFKMPSLWALTTAIILNNLGVDLHQTSIAYQYWHKILDAWLVVGMMMIGIALASCKSLKPDIKFCCHMMAVRFLVWPLICGSVIILDYHLLHLFNADIYFILAVFSFVPLPGNSVALSATLGLHPDKIAFAVVLSTLIATILVSLFIGDIYNLLVV